ncbi:nuclease-related domain-containing protein [Salinicoccus sp. CNSTN-B1]
MFITDRRKSKELLFYEALEARCSLTGQEGKRLRALRRGFEGESAYDALWETIGHDHLLIFRDIWLQVGNAVLQADALIIDDGQVTVNEIKNYSGLYRLENAVWSVNGYRISEDPVAQVRRTVGKLTYIKSKGGHSFQIDGKVIFINPDFNLISDSEADNLHIINRAMLKPYMGDVAAGYAGREASDIAETIKSCIIDDPMRVPELDPGRINPGIRCARCSAVDLSIGRYAVECRQCSHHETIERLVVRAIVDYSNLFPDGFIDKKQIQWMLADQVGLRCIEHALSKYCIATKRGKHAAYTVETPYLEELLAIKQYKSRYEKKPSQI